MPPAIPTQRQMRESNWDADVYTAGLVNNLPDLRDMMGEDDRCNWRKYDQRQRHIAPAQYGDGTNDLSRTDHLPKIASVFQRVEEQVTVRNRSINSEVHDTAGQHDTAQKDLRDNEDDVLDVHIYFPFDFDDPSCWYAVIA
jgi:hypothetical protein